MKPPSELQKPEIINFGCRLNIAEAATAQGNIGVQVWINQGMYEGEDDGANAKAGQASKKPKRTLKR